MFQLAAAAITILMAVRPAQTMDFIRNGMDLCYEVIIPGLFPFFVVSGLLVYSGFPKTLAKVFKPVMKPLFNINENGAAAFVIGLISGYPAGAATVCELYKTGYVSKSEAERMLAFCNNSGPLFIIGSVGAAMYSSVSAGVMLYICHILASIIVGIMFRFYGRSRHHAPEYMLSQPDIPFTEVCGKVMKDSAASMINVCASVIFFSAVTELVFGLFPQIPTAAGGLLKGIFEFTNGTRIIAESTGGFAEKMIMTAFAVGFAGFCVHLQVVSVVSGCGLSVKPYILGKLLHGVTAAVLVWIYMNTLYVQTGSGGSIVYDFMPAVTGVSIIGVLIIMTAAVSRYSGGKEKKRGYNYDSKSKQRNTSYT